MRRTRSLLSADARERALDALALTRREGLSLTAAARPSETLEIVVVATEVNQARLLRRAIGEHFERPGLRQLVRRRTEYSIELANNTAVSALATNARSLRGRAIPVLILDEFAHLVDSTGSAITAEEIWSATVPAVSQFPTGRVLVLSTPRWSSGLFFELTEQAASGLYPDMATWHASTAEMNPSIPDEVLAVEASRDPANYRREFLAEWDSGIGALFDEETIRAATRSDEILPPTAVDRYVISSDPAYTGDRWAILVGHRRGGRVIVDRVTGFEGSRGRPVDHETALGTIAELSKAYNRARVVTDQMAAQPIVQGLIARGLQVDARPWTNDSKLDAATTTRRLLNEGRLELPPHRLLVSELLQLEQRPLPSGRPRIEAPRSAHDNYAIALLALCHELIANPYDYGADFAVTA